jgi:hypothetical protein
MAQTYRVVEAAATDPEDIEAWMNQQAADGWRVVSVAMVPANSVSVRVGGSILHPEYQTSRGFKMDGIGSDTFSSSVVFNAWVTLERESA